MFCSRFLPNHGCLVSPPLVVKEHHRSCDTSLGEIPKWTSCRNPLFWSCTFDSGDIMVVGSPIQVPSMLLVDLVETGDGSVEKLPTAVARWAFKLDACWLFCALHPNEIPCIPHVLACVNYCICLVWYQKWLETQNLNPSSSAKAFDSAGGHDQRCCSRSVKGSGPRKDSPGPADRGDLGTDPAI